MNDSNKPKGPTGSRRRLTPPKRPAPPGSASTPEAPPDAVAAETGAETARANGDFKSLPAPDQDMSRQQLAEKYTPYVRSIAGKIKKTLSKDIEFDDLVSYGMLGLMEAADRFDAKYGANFMTFAYYRVRGAIFDGLRGMGWVNRTEYQRYRFEQRANAYLSAVNDQDIQPPVGIRRSDDDEITDLANVVEGLVTIYVTALDAMEGFEVQDDRGPSIEESIELQQARELVQAALEKLGGQEKTLLELYYYQEMSLEEVGKELGLSKSWTSRLHSRAVQKMGRLLKDLIAEYDEDRNPVHRGAKKKGGGRRSTQPTGPPGR